MPSSQDFDFTIVAHRQLSAGAPDDILLAEKLRGRGQSVRFAVWDDERVDWSLSPVTIIRSAWDYFQRPALWFEWISTVANETRLVNDPETLHWNTDKRYLLDLIASGVNCVPTEIVEDDRFDLAAIARNRGWTDLIIKPVIAASASGVKRFSENGFQSGQRHLSRLLQSGAAIVQPYMSEVETLRERSLVFISGKFQHAFSKSAFSTNNIGETAIKQHTPSENEKALGFAAAGALTNDTTYARVDMVPTQYGPLLMELELIEPDLGLRLWPESADVLADNLVLLQNDKLPKAFREVCNDPSAECRGRV